MRIYMYLLKWFGLSWESITMKKGIHQISRGTITAPNCVVIVWLLCGADGKICASIANFINSVFFCKKICVSQKNNYSCIIQIFFVPLQRKL